MGYKRDKPVYKLKFVDDEFDGLEVIARSLPLGEFFKFEALRAQVETDPDAAEQVVAKVADVLVSWNLLDDDDQPVPCDLDGLKTLDLPFVMAIFQAWIEAVAAVPNRLPASSNAGVTSLEPSIPMDLL